MSNCESSRSTPRSDDITELDGTAAYKRMLEQILCSSCFDLLGENIRAIIPQSTCAVCEKKCLGYRTSREVR